MAFVLVQHMDPTHESLLYQLLSKATAMPVAQIADRTRLEPNRVYVIPPNKDLTVDRGVLRLANLRSGHMPIDNFFSSLAKDRQEKAIGVILSGTASDGTRGLKAIKDFGGITFAQDREIRKVHRHADERCRVGLCRFCFASATNRSPAPTAGTASWCGRF